MKRAFIDSSVLFAAACSAGKARDLIDLGIQGKIQLVISSLVMEETRKNLARYAPEALAALEQIFNTILFEIFNPSKETVVDACRLVTPADAPLVAAARSAHVDVLVTLDQAHLLERPALEGFAGVRILAPEQAYGLMQPAEASR